MLCKWLLSPVMNVSITTVADTSDFDADTSNGDSQGATVGSRKANINKNGARHYGTARKMRRQ